MNHHQPDDRVPEFGLMNRESLALASANALLVIPVGATEQHGPGLPTSTDNLHVEEVTRRAVAIASTTIPIVVAPNIPFGCSDHHLPFGATLSLGTNTLLSVLADLGASAVRSGFTRVFFMNGHGGNQEVVQLAARDLSVIHGCHAAGGSWWAIARDDLLATGAGERGPVPGHAGGFESSLVQPLGHTLVDSESFDLAPGIKPVRPDAPYRAEFGGLWKQQDGYTDDPRTGTAEHGRTYLEAASVAVANHLIGFYRAIEHLEG